MRIDIERLIDEAPLGALQWRVLLLCALAAFLDGFDVTAISQATPAMAAEWHVTPGELRWIVTSAVIGIAASALLVAPLGDYFGRRVVLLCSFLLVGFATLMASTTHAGEPAGLFRLLSFESLLGPKLVSDGGNQLFVWRFLTGLGLGASLPNALALGAEYAPKRSRTALVALLACAISLGSATCGLLAPTLMQWGGSWRAIFVAGGSVALLAFLPLLALPESPRFLVLRGVDPGRIGRLLVQLGGGFLPGKDDQFALAEGRAARLPVSQLLSTRLLPATLLLWLVFFLNLGMLYLVSSWLPTLLNEIGLPLTQAQRTSSLFQLGGVAGGLVLAVLIKRLGPYRLLIVSYTLGALALLALSTRPVGLLLGIAVIFIGNGINGAQVALNALAATLYPTAARASGVGWALGVGRFGAILGPLIAGALLAQGGSAAHVLWLVAFPALGCAAAVALLWAAVARTAPEASVPSVTTSP
jgi:AAHS family 4-hydroxybenzoate transporter-like MFS transporter